MSKRTMAAQRLADERFRFQHHCLGCGHGPHPPSIACAEKGCECRGGCGCSCIKGSRRG